MKKIKFILTFFLLLILYIYVVFINQLPNNIILLEGEKYEIKEIPGVQVLEVIETSNENINSTKLEIKLFNKIPVKDISVTKMKNTQVVPVGKIIGLKMYTNGVLVVGMSEIEDYQKILNKPYENTDIKSGDTILKINEEIVENIESLKKIVNDSEGKNLNLTIFRNGTIINTDIKPVQTDLSEYKIGLWVKDAATGVGTMSFYIPETKEYGILGHGITDSDTNNLINLDSGELVTARIISLKKAEKGFPGEIKGTIINSQTIGDIKKNTQFGVYGKLNNITSLNIDISKKIDIALRNEIKEGRAKVLCAFNENNVTKEYDIEIEKIYIDNDYNNKSMMIKIIDDELINETGGIIRGLSGAPIIQNGKFIGAITNVLVSDPSVGYAIFADLMVKELNKAID